MTENKTTTEVHFQLISILGKKRESRGDNFQINKQNFPDQKDSSSD